MEGADKPDGKGPAAPAEGQVSTERCYVMKIQWYPDRPLIVVEAPELAVALGMLWLADDFFRTALSGQKGSPLELPPGITPSSFLPLRTGPRRNR